MQKLTGLSRPYKTICLNSKTRKEFKTGKTFKIMLDAGHYGEVNQYHVLKPIKHYESTMTWKFSFVSQRRRNNLWQF